MKKDINVNDVVIVYGHFITYLQDDPDPTDIKDAVGIVLDKYLDETSTTYLYKILVQTINTPTWFKHTVIKKVIEVH